MCKRHPRQNRHVLYVLDEEANDAQREVVEMSRDFILVFGGGMVSLVTTLVVLFIADFMNRRGEAKRRIVTLPPPPESITAKLEHVEPEE
jgi:hypothetical protein